jgi:predicted dehydrogenase
LGRDGAVAPSNRINLGVVGTHQGMDSINRCKGIRGVQVTSICDLDDNQCGKIVGEIDKFYKTKGTKGYRDFRDMFAKANLDAVVLAAPDHWHGIMAVAAARAGLDIYGEKPIAHTLAEGRAIANAVKQHGRIWQTGSWQRSDGKFFRAVELVRNGRIGKITHVQVGTLATQNGFSKSLSTKTPADVGKPPSHFDHDLWIGPAAWMDYDSRFSVYHWRWILNFGGGNLMDWVGHHVDIAHWALGFDETGPIKVTGNGVFSTKLPWDAATKYSYECTYANGQVINVGSNYSSGVKFFGEDGKWIQVDRGRLTASNKGILDSEIGPEEYHPYRSPDHWRNFIDCVRNRGVTIAPAETAHRTASVGHLGHIAVQTGRTINWDPVTETIKDDPLTTALLSPTFRSPWVL